MSMSENTELIDAFEEFYRNYYRDELGQLAQKYPKDQKSLEIDYHQLYRYNRDLADDFRTKPGQIREYAEEALALYDLPVDVNLSGAHVRLVNLPESETYEVGAPRQEDMGNYLALAGQVTKTSQVRPKVTEAAFECQRCGTLNRIPQTDGDRQEPHECKGCERQGPFRLNPDQSQFVDHQLIRVNEPPEQAQGAQGNNTDVVLEDDLTGTVDAGDRVTLSGILTLDQRDDNDKSTTFDTYLEGGGIQIEETDFEEIDVSKYKDEIIEIANNDPIQQLVDSLAPKLQRMDDIKTALVLQLFSGVKAHYPDGGVDRGDFHVLLLGDPGCGKSTLLRAVEKIAPRSTYSSGKGASAAGMTGAAVRDDFGDTEWSIEAGALAVANKGIACVDEIDKVDDKAVSSLHDALESQRINLSKAGINATLQAETALLAGGNPKYGRFDQYEPIGDQIDLGSALLSRFDLMFMLSDAPDQEKDRDISSSMLESRRKANRYTHDLTVTEDDLGDIQPEISLDTMRAYIAYAKQNVHPVIPEHLDERIVEWYTDLRQANGEDGPIPVTARKAEAFQRLAEAAARARLSDVVEEQDIELVKHLVMSSMKDVGVDPETGEYDADVVETGTSKSQRDRRHALLDVIAELEQEYDRGAPREDILMHAMEHEWGQNQTEHDIGKLLERGEIYENADGYYRTTDHTV